MTYINKSPEGPKDFLEREEKRKVVAMHELRSHSKGILGQHRKLEAQFPQFGVLLFTHLV